MTNETKHTPGPCEITGRYSIYHNGPLAYCGDTTATPGDGEANARLIAAAPELLDALQGLLNALPSATTHPAIKAARAAIRKATGEG